MCGLEVTGLRAGFCASGVDLCVRVVAVGSKRGRRFLSFAIVCVLYVCVLVVVVAVGWRQEGQGLQVGYAGREGVIALSCVDLHSTQVLEIVAMSKYQKLPTCRHE